MNKGGSMWRLDKIFAGIFFLFFFSFMSSAETLNWTVEQFEEYGLQHSPLLKISELNVSEAKMDVVSALSSLLPEVSASGYRIFNHKLGEMVIKMPDPMTGELRVQRFKMGTSDNIGGSIIIKQNIFTGGALINSLKMRKYAYNSSKYSFKFTKQQLKLNIRALYYQILFLQKLVNVYQESYNRTKENLRIVELLYKNKGASKFEKLRAEVDFKNTLPKLEGAKKDLSTAIANFKKLIGLPLDTDIQLSDELDTINDTIIQKYKTLDEMKKVALENRADLKQSYWNMKIAEKGVNLSFSNFLPKIFYQYENAYQANIDNLGTFKFPKDDEWINSAKSTIGISLPIFTGFKNTSQYKKSRMQRLQAKYVYDDKTKEVLINVETAYKEYQIAKENLDTYTTTYEQAKEGYKIAKILYENGGASQLDLISAQESLTQASTFYFKSIADYNVAYYNLLLALGIL